MSDFWAKTKAKAAEAADVSKRAAKRTKAKADLELLRRKLNKLKQDFGVEVFPFYESDREKSDAIYGSYRARIDAVVQAINAKNEEIRSLGEKKQSNEFPNQDNHDGPSMSEI